MSPATRRREAGKGLIGFIVALVVVIYLFIAIQATYKVKSRGDVMDDFVYQTLGEAERRKWNEEDVRGRILEKAKEIGVTGLHAGDIQVARESSRWIAHLEWEDTLSFPGVERKWKFTVDKSYTRY